MQKLLAKMGATKVSAYVTHGVFPKRSWERFVHDNGGTYSKRAWVFYVVGQVHDDDVVVYSSFASTGEYGRHSVWITC